MEPASSSGKTNTAETLRLRRATKDDFLAIAALDREAWNETPHSEFIPDGEHVWRLWVDHALVFCAVTSEGVQGAALAFPCLDERFFLHKIFVNAACRGTGLGSQLMGCILQEIDALNVEVCLTVNPANEPALRLYERWGFTQRTFHAGYYRPHEDRFVLTRPVAPTLDGTPRKAHNK